jgi:hypothetical protein
VIEKLPAPPIHIVRRTDVPMTSAAEYFCDLMRRASAQISPVDSATPGSPAVRSDLNKNPPSRQQRRIGAAMRVAQSKGRR